jgi:hypothetical protein
MGEVSYMVSGRLVEAGTRRPMAGHGVVVETGIRDENSPLDLLGVRGSGRTDANGDFERTFITPGMAIPAELEVHILFDPGGWRCRVVPVAPANVEADGAADVRIELGTVEVDYDKCRAPKGDVD